MSERKKNYTLMEGHMLPSKGHLYDEPVDPNVEITPMTARDEMRRTSPSSTPLKTLADIIEDRLVEKPAVKVYDMAFGDYEFLLHKLRIATYGPKYKMNCMCDKCQQVFETEADLEKLEVLEYDEDEINKFRDFRLPESGKSITLRYLTPRLEEDFKAKTDELRRRSHFADLDFSVYAKLLSIIDLVDGQKYPEYRLQKFIDDLHARDMLTILNNFDKLNGCVGLDTTVNLKCPYCGGDVRTRFLFGPEFFRPTNN